MRRQSLIYTAPDIGFLTVTDNLNRTYQYVTSSNTGIDGVITGLTLNPFKIKEIIVDIMDDFPEIQIATAYQLNGQILDSFPADLQKLARAQVQYTT
ncbi:hypothetical protein HO133_007138 [Letharia lupina]|uniref:Uncharacterized protein n=1 Tax=Letharia lupina TaxID=560253 RepID=A0A8H6FI87_9LECA|nr:uncharacterized protein HO133_007138 [Letharia lupina]KAF6229024.1 hypothetical protein HO133_007138 [Letharia lupina]